MRTKVLLVTRRGGQSLTRGVARSLQEASSNIFLGVGSSFPFDSFVYNNFCNKVFELSDLKTEREKHINEILTVIEKENINVVIPCTDIHTLILSKHKEKIEELGARSLLPDLKTVEITAFKTLTYKFMGRINIPQPIYFVPVSRDDVDAIVDILGKNGILVVKEEKSKHRIVPNAKAAKEFFDWMRNMFHSKILIQEYIPGKEVCTISMVDESHEVVSMVTIWKIETDMNGETQIGVTIDREDVQELSYKIISKLKWCGPIEVEWRIDDRDGLPKLQEVNGRFTAWQYLATSAGINQPYQYLQLLYGEHPKKCEYKIGKAFIRSPEDITFDLPYNYCDQMNSRSVSI